MKLLTFTDLLEDLPKFRSCYRKLVDTLLILPDDLLVDIANGYLSKERVAKSSPEAGAMLDGLVAVSARSKTAQRLIVGLVLNAPSVDQEIVKTALHVCFGIVKPIEVSGTLVTRPCYNLIVLILPDQSN